MRKRLLSGLLAFAMVLTMTPTAFAAEADTPVSNDAEQPTETPAPEEQEANQIALLRDDSTTKKVVAKLGETEYTNIDDALTAWAANGGTLTLQADCTTAGTDTSFEVLKDATLDLNGKTLTLGTSKYIAAGRYDTTICLTVQDSTGKGKLVTDQWYYAINLAFTSTLIINNAEIEGLKSNAVTSSGKVIMNGGKLSGKTQGLNLEGNDGTVTVNKGEINSLKMNWQIKQITLGEVGGAYTDTHIGMLLVNGDNTKVDFNSGIIDTFSTNYSPTLNMTENAYFVNKFTKGIPEGKCLKAVTKDGKEYYQLAELNEETATAAITDMNGGRKIFADASVAAADVKAGETLTLLKAHSGDTLRINAEAGSVTVDLNHQTVENKNGPALYVTINGEYDAVEPYTVKVKNGTLISQTDVALRVDASNNAVNVVTENVTMQPAQDKAAIDLQDSARLVFTDEADAANLVDNGFTVAANGENYAYGVVGGLWHALKVLPAAGGTVKLLKDYTGSQMLRYTDETGKPVVLDLNGKTYNYTYNSKNSFALELGHPNSNLTIRNGTIQSASAYAVYVGMTSSSSANNLKLTLDGVTLKAPNGFGINGTLTGNETTIKNSVIEAEDTGIYYPANGSLTIENSKISGEKLGVVLKGGKIKISGNDTKISAAANEKEPSDYYKGDDKSSITAEGYALYVEGGYNWDTTVNISGGVFASKGDAVKKYVKDTDTAHERVISISGGYFTSNPTDYLAKGYVAGSSDKSGYSYKVAEKTNTGNIEVKPAVAKPEVNTDNIKDDDKEAVENTAKSVAVPTLGATATDEAQKIDKEKAENLLSKASGMTTAKLYVQSALKVTPTNYSNTAADKKLELDITPQYRVVASTATTAEGIQLDGEGKNAEVVQNYADLTINTPTQIVMQLPSDFAAVGDKLSIQHTKSSGIEYYTGIVSENAGKQYLTFTTNGFSPFVISVPAAFIGENAYPTFRAAVDNAKNGDTIILKKVDEDGMEFTFRTTKSIQIENRTGAEVTIKFNGVDRKVADNATETFSYTKPSKSSGSSDVTYKVMTASVANGAVKASSSNAKKGETITITLSPDEGYKPDTLTVTSGSGEKISTIKKSDTVYTFLMPASQVTIRAAYIKAASVSEDATKTAYADVFGTDWFADAVRYVTEKGIMSGTDKTTFDPKLDTTRGMIVTILYRLENEPNASAAAFTDVAADKYYANAVGWASTNGIVKGYSNTIFAPEDKITREQLAAILYRYAQYKNYDVSVGEETNILSYADAQSVSEYAIPAIQWACGAGVVSGKPDNRLDPQGSATRAEVAAMLMRFCENAAK